MSISTTSLDDLPNPSQEGAVNLKINDPTAGLQSQRDNELRQALPQAPQKGKLTKGCYSMCKVLLHMDFVYRARHLV